MNTQETYTLMQALYSQLPHERKNHNGVSEYKTDNALRLTLEDIDESGGSKELIKILGIGFRASRNIMTLIITDQEPTLDSEGMFVYKFGGRGKNGELIGTELTVNYNLDEVVTGVSVIPTLAMIPTSRGGVISAEQYLERMVTRHHRDTLIDAVVMIKLGAKAVGLPIE